MATKLGFDAKVYYVEGGVGGGSWKELTNVRDVTLTLEKGEADVTTRANNGWEATEPTLKVATAEFSMVWDTADEGFAAIRDAFLENDKIGLAILDGDINSGEGLVANFAITSFVRNEQLREALTVDVTAKVGYSPNNPPQWVENGVIGGSSTTAA